jgi:hypothetical protein
MQVITDEGGSYAQSVVGCCLCRFSHLVHLCVTIGQCPEDGRTPPINVSRSQDLAAGEVFGECAFPVRLQLNGKASTITLPGDRFIFTSPGLDVTLTNLNDPAKSVTLNITGTSRQSTASNGDILTVVTGRNLQGDPDAGFVLAIGSFSFKFDAAGNLVQPLAGTGQLIAGLGGPTRRWDWD